MLDRRVSSSLHRKSAFHMDCPAQPRGSLPFNAAPRLGTPLHELGTPRQYTNGCIVVCMGRTNIEIDGELVSEAMRRYGLHSKRAAVDLALRRLVGESMSREEALEMEGAGWEGDLEEMRRDHRLVG